MKACCVTGHRTIPEGQIARVRAKLVKEVALAVADGFTVFISGCAEGADLLFAEVVLEQKLQTPGLFLEAAIPYAGRMRNSGARLQGLLRRCDGVKVVCQEYRRDCFFLRNRYMVEQSQRVIAVYDGRDSGGTLYTMRYAQTMGAELRVIGVKR